MSILSADRLRCGLQRDGGHYMRNPLHHLALAALLTAGAASAQDLSNLTDFNVFGQEFQVHGFFTQGFMYSGNNNYLSANTTSGAFGPTDGGANISTQITDKFRVGAQVYFFNVGHLGEWRPELDWAVADYKFTDWFGIRAGKVKTTFGLYTDTQDMSFLQTFALMPQSIYNIDSRDESIAHEGGDLYGTVSLKQLGSLSYTGFAGDAVNTPNSGYIYSLEAPGIYMTKYGGLNAGGDLRWNAPLSGLVLGGAYKRQYPHGEGSCSDSPACRFLNAGGEGPYWEKYRKDYEQQFFGQYSHGKFRFDSEYRRQYRDHTVFSGGATATLDARSWYTAVAYRISSRLELGSYYSHLFEYSWLNTAPYPNAHIIDKVVAARFDLTRYSNLKVEGHFMNGTGHTTYPWGFYTAANPDGLQDQTPMLIIRLGFNL
jgi:hypothetical protein